MTIETRYVASARGSSPQRNASDIFGGLLFLRTWGDFSLFCLDLALKRADDDKLMKFQRAAEFMRVPPDLTTFSALPSLCVFHLTWLLLLYTNTWLSVYCFHCIHGIVTLKPKVRSGNRREAVFEGNGRDAKKYPLNCVGFRQRNEWG
jgi:hypothetical protein